MERPRGRNSGVAAAAALLLALAQNAPGQPAPTAAGAMSLVAAPVRLDIAATAKAEVLTLTNPGAQRGDVQVRALAWSQRDGEDSYQPTDAIIVSPPRFSLAPGASQTVRIYRRDPAPAAELSYRIAVDQLPAAGAPVAAGVQLPIRLMIPLFVAGAQPASTDLRWQARRSGDGVQLELANQGNRHVRISSLGLAPARADTAQTPPVPRLIYLLPGTRRSLQLPRPDWLDQRVRALRIHGDSDAGPIDARVDLLDAP